MQIDRKILDANDGYREYVTRVEQEVEDKLLPRVTAFGWPIMYIVKQVYHGERVPGGRTSIRLAKTDDVYSDQHFHIPAGVTIYEMTGEVYRNMGFYSYL